MSDSPYFNDDAFSNSADLLLQAMATVGAVAWRWDLHNDEFFYSAELAELLGLDLNLQQKNLLSLLPSNERQGLYRTANRAFDNNDVLEDQLHLQLEHGSFPFRIIGSRMDFGDPAARFLAGILITGVDTGQMFSSIISNAEVLAFVKDLQGRYLFVNEQYAGAYQREQVSFIGQTDDELFPDKNLSRLQGLELQVMQLGRSVQVEENLVTDRKRRFLSSRFPITNGHGELYAIGGILTDISRLKQYELTIDAQRRNLQGVIDAVPAEITHFDINACVIALNKQAAQSLEQSTEQVKGKTLLEISPDNDAMARAHETIVQVIATAESCSMVVNRCIQDDVFIWERVDTIPLFSKQSQVTGVLQVSTDVSEIKENELKLMRREASYSAFIANSSEAILGSEIRPPMPLALDHEAQLDWISKHLICSEANQKAAAMLLHSIEDLTGKHAMDVVSEENRSVYRDYLDRLIKDNYATSRFLGQFKTPTNDTVWFELSGRGRIENGKLTEIWSVFRDITEQKMQELALRRSELRYRMFIAKSHEGIFSLSLPQPLDINKSAAEQHDEILHTIFISECNEELTRQHQSDCKGRLLVDVFGTDVASRLIKSLIENNYEMPEQELEVVGKSGVSHWYLVNIDGIVEAGCLTGCWAISRDITERRRYLNELEFQANHDSLTLLPNRKALYADINARLDKLAINRSQCIALMLIDLDRFKEINDTLGHHMGDKLLKQLGPRLQEVLKSSDSLVARLGGDEFAIIVTEPNEAAALDKAFKALLAIKETFDLDGFKADISASIGIAFAPKHGRDVGVLMRYADVAMYRAKTESMGVLEYDKSFDEHTPKRLSLITDLGRAIKEKQLLLVFQPKVDLREKRLKSVEALLRWRHPSHGMVPPGEFIPLAETTELIRPLTSWVLDTALAQCRQWQDQGLNIPVAINLSARSLHDENIVYQVKGALIRHGVPASSLELEITESAIMADPQRALRVLQLMDELGVYLSIDDFGTGYSSLAYLKKLPVDLLKIDASFVTDMLSDDQDAIIVNSTIHLAHNLGLQVIAEGVENDTTLTELHSMGCDQAQGYYVAKPMDALEFSLWLGRTAWLPYRLSETT